MGKNQFRLLLIILVFLVTGVISASEVFEGELCTIEAETTIISDVLVLCGELLVDGVIDGNLIGAARTATIRGEVTGSIYLVGGELLLAGGTIGKDVHFGGLVMNVQPGTRFAHEQGGIVSVVLSNIIDPQAIVPGSVTMLGYQLIVQGVVGREINFTGSALEVSGLVDGNVTATVGDSASTGASSQIETLFLPFRLLDVAPFRVQLIDPGLLVTGEIKGRLDYRGPTPGTIEGNIGSVVYASTTPPVVVGTNQVEQSARRLQRYAEVVLREFVTLFLVGAFFLLVAPRQMQVPLRDLRVRPLSSLGVGLLSFILSFPIVLILMVLSVVIFLIFSRLPLDSLAIFIGGSLGMANIGGASVFYFTAIYLSRIVVALALGRFVLRLFFRHRDHWQRLFLSLAVGVLGLSMVISIPVVGWGVNALTLFLGLGAILSVLRRQFQRFAESNPAAPAAYATTTKAESLPLLPYFPEYNSRPMGGENLPEGFNWWQGGEEDAG